MKRMYHPINGVLVWVTHKYIPKWKEMGFIVLNDKVIIFPNKVNRRCEKNAF